MLSPLSFTLKFGRVSPSTGASKRPDSRPCYDDKQENLPGAFILNVFKEEAMAPRAESKSSDSTAPSMASIALVMTAVSTFSGGLTVSVSVCSVMLPKLSNTQTNTSNSLLELASPTKGRWFGIASFLGSPSVILRR